MFFRFHESKWTSKNSQMHGKLWVKAGEKKIPYAFVVVEIFRPNKFFLWAQRSFFYMFSKCYFPILWSQIEGFKASQVALRANCISKSNLRFCFSSKKSTGKRKGTVLMPLNTLMGKNLILEAGGKKNGNHHKERRSHTRKKKKRFIELRWVLKKVLVNMTQWLSHIYFFRGKTGDCLSQV